MITNPLRPFVPAIYAVGIVMLLVAIGDYSGQLWPFRPTEVGWRYGAVGIFSNFLVTPVFALLLIGAAAAVGGHRIMLRILGVIGIGFTAALLVSIALFSLDALQVRQQAEPGAKWLTTISASMAAAKLLMAAAVSFILGLGTLKASKVIGGPERQGRERTGLVVGTS